MSQTYTTTTQIARKGKNAFENISYSTVLYNNKDIGMILGKEFSKLLIESGILQQIREEMWEINDDKTVNTIKKYREGKNADSISLDDFRLKYEI